MRFKIKVWVKADHQEVVTLTKEGVLGIRIWDHKRHTTESWHTKVFRFFYGEDNRWIFKDENIEYNSFVYYDKESKTWLSHGARNWDRREEREYDDYEPHIVCPIRGKASEYDCANCEDTCERL